MRVTGIDPSGGRAWCASIMVRPIAEVEPERLHFPRLVAADPAELGKLRLGQVWPKSQAALTWTHALERVDFAAPEWAQPGGFGELASIMPGNEQVWVESQWLNMREVMERQAGVIARGGQPDAPAAWQGVNALVQTVGAVRAARAHAAPTELPASTHAPSSWRAIALRNLPHVKRAEARKSEQTVTGLLLGGYETGPLGPVLASPREDLAAALCIALAAAGLPWFAVTPAADLIVTLAPSVPVRQRPGRARPAAG